MIAVAVVGAAVAIMVVDGPMRWRCVAFFAGLAIDPIVAFAAPAFVVGYERMQRIARIKKARRRIREDEILAVELVAAGVSAGVSFDMAVDAAAGHVDDVVASDMARWLRLVRHGHRPSDADTVTAELVRIAHGAEASGAAVADQLSALAESELAKDEADTNERLARLPVTMLFPLALLILPGFLLVAVAPTVIGGIARLGL